MTGNQRKSVVRQIFEDAMNTGHTELYDDLIQPE